jgi:hypothetical protein
MSYEVGQILYTILKDKQAIIPVKIVEQIVIKDLEGEVTNYKVLLPNKKGKKISIDKLDNTFEDLDEVNEFILERAKSSISKMIESAINLEEEFFNIVEEKLNRDSLKCKNETNNSIIKNNQIKINLDNGQTANIIDNTNILNTSIINGKEKEEINNESTTS